MACCYGEDFKAPIDFTTGKPIPGAPLIARPSTNRPDGSGWIVLADDAPDRQAGGSSA